MSNYMELYYLIHYIFESHVVSTDRMHQYINYKIDINAPLSSEALEIDGFYVAQSVVVYVTLMNLFDFCRFTLFAMALWVSLWIDQPLYNMFRLIDYVDNCVSVLFSYKISQSITVLYFNNFTKGSIKCKPKKQKERARSNQRAGQLL